MVDDDMRSMDTREACDEHIDDSLHTDSNRSLCARREAEDHQGHKRRVFVWGAYGRSEKARQCLGNFYKLLFLR